MTKTEAEKILNLHPGYTIYDVRNAYRALMTDGDVLNDADARAAYNMLANEMGSFVPAGRPNIDADPEKVAYAVRGAYQRFCRGSRLEKTAQLALDPPLDTPFVYRKIRFIVQHAPYRLLFILLTWGIAYIFRTCYWGDAAWFLFTTFALFMSFINLIYPMVTRPIRRTLIGLVDAIFGQTWFEEQEYVEAAMQLAKADPKSIMQ